MCIRDSGIVESTMVKKLKTFMKITKTYIVFYFPGLTALSLRGRKIEFHYFLENLV